MKPQKQGFPTMPGISQATLFLLNSPQWGLKKNPWAIGGKEEEKLPTRNDINHNE
ncbi:hypothetical protein [Desulforapulum autotrophicum]|uniref:hypothetical protein n=1 Tax=Desulforapulum autotrophicum TaxID=2296 RepID=UPI001E61196D|nr:hypothetical protein [Desulforapulum autotrophicum]